MDAIDAIRGRRTVKAFTSEPLGREETAELLELARWAPNHKLTCPWRFRVLGPKSVEALKQVAARLAASDAPAGADAEALGAAAAAKLDRAPTLIAVSATAHEDPQLDRENEHATAVAAYIVLLAAHARGFAGYWRTPAVLRDPEGLAAAGIGTNERFIGLLYLGRAAQTPGEPPTRAEPSSYVTWLD